MALTYVAVIDLLLNGTAYAAGDTILADDLPSLGKLRSYTRRGLINSVSSA